MMIAFTGVFALDAQAATFTVTTTADSGAGSLRQAVIDAEFAATDDIINFSPALSGQAIVLTGEIEITDTGTSGILTINGLGADVLTIDGGAGTNRIFLIDGATVTITDLTLTGGGGTGRINNGQGGAIFAFGSNLTLDRVHITANTTSGVGGGVVYNGGTHQISNSTFSSNVAANDCGGLYNNASTLTVVNTTISGNSVFAPDVIAFAGGICSNGNTTLRSVTITNNTASSGGGIYTFGGTFNIGNTIIAGSNGRSDNPEIRIEGGTFTSAGYNLVGDNPGDSTNTNTAITYQSTDIRDVDPLLAPLANYGGTTPTHALLSGSPAIDKGFSFSLTTDQRGLVRPVDNPSITNAASGDGSDIGAFEQQQNPTTSISISGTIRYGITETNQPQQFVSGVLLSATGTTSTSANSNAAGAYTLNGLISGGNYTVTPSKTGEVKGINSLDATRIQQYLVGLITLTPNQLIAADTDGNGTVNSLDATRIQQRLVGIQSSNIIGQWKFVPANRQYNSVSSNLLGENYEAILVGEVSGNWATASSFAEAAETKEEFLPKQEKFNNVDNGNADIVKTYGFSNFRSLMHNHRPMENTLKQIETKINFNGRAEKSVWEYLTNEEREIYADHLAGKRHFLSAAGFTIDTERKVTFLKLHEEKYVRKI
jgi:hypothetical protein